jgi:glycosyltransferase involved in cell wall biosynthesis
MDTPIIDIVIPNRNKAQFLPATLASLAAQTETRWRAIVIDGESTDGSLEILRAAAARDARITVRVGRPPSTTGQSFYRAWNQGLLHVRAPYFAILTSDDLWEPAWLERAIKALEAQPAAIAAAARAILINTVGEIDGPTPACRNLETSFALKGSGWRTLESRACCLRGLTQGPIFSTIHSLVFRRKVLEEGEIFSEDVGIAADIEYYLHTCLLGDVLYDLDSRAFFRIYPEQASGVVRGATLTRQWRKIVKRNQNLVAQRLGIPVAEMAAATQEILDRHCFMMTKPDRETFRRSKAIAAWRFVQAGLPSPRLLIDYLRCRSNFDRFLTATAADLTEQLTVKYSI